MSDGGECEAWGVLECEALYFGAYVSEGHAASIYSIEDAAWRRELLVLYRKYVVAAARLLSAQFLSIPSLCITDCLFTSDRVSVAKLQTANGFISEKAEVF